MTLGWKNRRHGECHSLWLERIRHQGLTNGKLKTREVAKVAVRPKSAYCTGRKARRPGSNRYKPINEESSGIYYTQTNYPIKRNLVLFREL